MRLRGRRTWSTRIWRAVATGATSILLGAAFGLIATLAMGMGSMADFAVVFGAAAGILSAPALIFGLWHGPWLRGLVVIAAPTAVAAFFGGLMTPPNGGPIMSMTISVGAYLLASLVRGIIGWKRAHTVRPGACPCCEYDLSGLPSNTTCPECGAAAESK